MLNTYDWRVGVVIVNAMMLGVALGYPACLVAVDGAVRLVPGSHRARTKTLLLCINAISSCMAAIHSAMSSEAMASV